MINQCTLIINYFYNKDAQLQEQITADNTATTQNIPQKNFTLSGMIEKVNYTFWSGLGSWSTYNLLDAGLARFFALETLRHGTGPLGYIGINIFGADPNFGGSKSGSSMGIGLTHYINNSKNFFHVFKDSEIPTDSYLSNIFLPRYHAMLSGIATFRNSSDDQDSTKQAVGGIVGLLTPTLKFRFAPEEILTANNIHLFQNDPDYGGLAYRTTKAISPLHLGITGDLTQGINSGMFDRMAAQPEKVKKGLFLIGTAILVGYVVYRYIYYSQEEKRLIVSSNITITFFQRCRNNVKVLVVKSFWITFAVTNIFLNTL